MAIHFEWKKDISVGDYTIDTQHQKLLAQINKILDAIVLGVDSKEVQDSMIDFLSMYIKEHLTYEEEYMKEIGYPEREEHIKIHRDFILNYVKFKERFIKGEDKDKLMAEIEQYIGSWWIDHIGKEDRKYHLYVEEKRKK